MVVMDDRYFKILTDSWTRKATKTGDEINFVKDCVTFCSMPKQLLTDNDQQVVEMFYNSVCVAVGTDSR